jgi:hypothetical protein
VDEFSELRVNLIQDLEGLDRVAMERFSFHPRLVEMMKPLDLVLE